MLIDWFTVVAQALNFLILVLLLKRFLYGPIIRAMEEREARIAARLAEAGRMKEEAAQEAESYRQQNQELQETRAELLGQARTEAESRRQELLQKARAEIDEARARWQKALQQEQDVFLQELRRRTISQVHATARRALADLADTDLETHLAHVFIQRLQQTAEDGEVAAALRQAAQEIVVRSAFEISPELRQTILGVVQEQTQDDVEARFETAPDLICGIELAADGYKIAWSLADYLDSLEEELFKSLENGEKAA